MSASRNPLLAGLKKAYALAHGCDERTARRHANGNTESWQAFIAKTGVSAAEKMGKPSGPPPDDAETAAIQVLSPASPANVPAPIQAGRPDSELSETEKIVKMQWNIYVQASKAWQAAMKDQDAVSAAAFGMAAGKALETYYRALAKHEDWLVRQRRYIPYDEFQAMLPLMEAIFALIRGYPSETALDANPTNPQLARDAGQNWLATRFSPQAEDLLKKLEDATAIDASLSHAA